MRLLVVDDDPKLRSLLKRGLEESSIDCETAGSVADALEIVKDVDSSHFDLILLDVMLPDRTGWEFLSELRRIKDMTPVIFLTARHEVEERVKGLRLGADDYIIKPFEFTELLARVDAVMRRGAPYALDVGDLRLDLSKSSAERDGHRIELSPREFGVLWALASSDGAPISRNELLEGVWEIDFDPGTNVVEVVIARLRRKLELRGARMIETVPGEGYRLVDSTSSAT